MSDPSVRDTSGALETRVLMRGLLPSILINAIAPLIAYQFLTGRGWSELAALAAAAIFPACGTILEWARTRQADVIGVTSLVYIVVGLIAGSLTGNAWFLLIRDSLATSVFGLICLLSLLFPKPALFYIGRQFSSGGDPTRAQQYDLRWHAPAFRRAMRFMTAVWGIGYALEAIVGVILSFVLPVSVFLVVSQLLAFGTTIGLILWVFRYAKQQAARGAGHVPGQPLPADAVSRGT